MTEPLDILVVEDSPEDAELMIRALNKRRLANRVLVLEDDAEALDLAFCRGAYRDRSFSQPPKVVLWI